MTRFAIPEMNQSDIEAAQDAVRGLYCGLCRPLYGYLMLRLLANWNESFITETVAQTTVALPRMTAHESSVGYRRTLAGIATTSNSKVQELLQSLLTALDESRNRPEANITDTKRV